MRHKITIEWDGPEGSDDVWKVAVGIIRALYAVTGKNVDMTINGHVTRGLEESPGKGASLIESVMRGESDAQADPEA